MRLILPLRIEVGPATIVTGREGRIYQAAFVVLVFFFAFIIFNDVTSSRSSNHVKP